MLVDCNAEADLADGIPARSNGTAQRLKMSFMATPVWPGTSRTSSAGIPCTSAGRSSFTFCLALRAAARGRSER
jgi:hypothetical protein